MRLPGFVRAAGRALPPAGERLLPALSGLLLVLAFPPFSLPVLPFVALVPLLLHVEGLPAGGDGRWRAFRAGLLTGLVYFGLLLYWLFIALVYYSALALPAYVLTALVLAGFTACFAAGLHYLRERLGIVPLALTAAVLWTSLEWLQANLGDLSFPWLGLGSALSVVPRAAGAADLVGARGLTVWLALANGVVATVILRIRAGRPAVRLAAGLAILVLVPIGYGYWRADALEVRPAARVAVVQPNIPEDLKLDGSLARDTSMAALENLTGTIEPGSVDLVVWPEVALPAAFAHPYETLLQERVQALSAAVRAPIVVGAYGLDEDAPTQSRTLYNSAYLVTGEGIEGAPYHKRYLVPFVERVPFIDPAWLERFIGDLQYFGGLGRGERAAPFVAADGERFGVLICYESIFAPAARDARLAGADYLLNITNDAWYGREPWYARTTALWQHPAHLAMRAIEQRVGIARSANTGISMFIDPLGRSYERTPLFVPEVRTATVYTTDIVTLYARWGDWLATLAVLTAVALLIAARVVGGPRSPRSSGPSPKEGDKPARGRRTPA